MNPRIEADNARALAMAVPDALTVVWNLAGIMAGVVGEGTSGAAALIVYFGLPMDVSGRIELADLELRAAVIAETANGPVHDVAGHPLNAVDEVVVLFSVERAIIDLPVLQVTVIEALLNKRKVVGVFDERTTHEPERVRRLAEPRHVKPAWT